MTLSISILISQTVFLSLLAKRIPETSLDIPLLDIELKSILWYIIFHKYIIIKLQKKYFLTIWLVVIYCLPCRWYRFLSLRPWSSAMSTLEATRPMTYPEPYKVFYSIQTAKLFETEASFLSLVLWKILCVSFTVPKISAWIVCRRRYGHFIFLRPGGFCNDPFF